MPGDQSDWQQRFAGRVVSADEAARRVRSGDLIRLPLGPVPMSLLDALARRRAELRGVRVFQAASGCAHPWCDGDASWVEHIEYVTDFVSQWVRPSIEARIGDFAVAEFSLGSKVRQPGRRDQWTPDVFMALVSEPDAEGFVSFGYSLWHSKALLQAARLGIAEICPGMIRTGGDNCVHLSKFDLAVPQAIPFELRPRYPQLSPERLEVTELVGAYVSTLVNDRDTVQIGTGTLSSAMGSYLTEKRDLGIDAEILVASVVELVKSGVASGRHKNTHPGVATASHIIPGSDFAFCDGNPRIELYDIEYVNHLPRIAGVRNLIAINQTAAIDLTGQAASESIGPVMYTGPGGQLVWTLGALMAPGGRAVLVLPSTAQRGTVSRIVAQHPPGTVITLPRTLVDYVVTEHGIANLQGLTQRQRSMALVDLAAEPFREQLRSEARRLFWP